MYRLENSASELAARLRDAPPAVQRSAARVAASWAIEVARVDQPTVEDALNRLARQEDASALRDLLGVLVQELDEVAWSLQDAADVGSASVEDYLLAFGRARAVNAVLFACDPKPEAAALEATYEASVVAADDGPLLAAVEDCLS